MCLPTINSIPINIKNEKCTKLKENDHIEPIISNMLKDVYVDVDYLPEYCDYNYYGNIIKQKYFKQLNKLLLVSDNKSSKLQKYNKINVQASIQKPTDNKSKDFYFHIN